MSTVTGNVKKSYDSTTKKESKPKQQTSATDEYPSTRSKQQKSLADNLGKTTKIKFYDNIDSVMDEYLKENYSNNKKEPKLKPKQQKSAIDSLDNIVNEYLIKNYGITTKKDTKVKPDDKITEVMDEYLKENYAITTKKDTEVKPKKQPFGLSNDQKQRMNELKKSIKQRNDEARKKRQENREKRAREKSISVTSYDFYDDDDDLFVADDDEHTKGYGIKPVETFTGASSIDPKKMLIKLAVLLARIHVGYSSEEIMKETKKILDSIYNSRLITNIVYNQLANL